MNFYPAIDLMEGRCVRLHQGRFDQCTEYAADPLEVARSYRESGTEYLHVVDLSGAREGRRQHAPLIGELIRSSGLATQVGGGIRSADEVAELLDQGAERVVLGSVAVADFKTVESWAQRFGPACLRIAIDCRVIDGRAWVLTDGWKSVSQLAVTEVLTRYLNCGVEHFLCTDIDQDGTGDGPNLDLYQRLQQRFPEAKIQASGGVGSLGHLRQLRSIEVESVIVGRALYEGVFSLREMLTC